MPIVQWHFYDCKMTAFLWDDLSLIHMLSLKTMFFSNCIVDIVDSVHGKWISLAISGCLKTRNMDHLRVRSLCTVLFAFLIKWIYTRFGSIESIWCGKKYYFLKRHVKLIQNLPKIQIDTINYILYFSKKFWWDFPFEFFVHTAL